MNKRYCIYGALMLLLVVSQPSFSMYNLAFRGVQALSAGYCIKRGIDEARENNKILSAPIDGELVQGRVKKWAQKNMEELNVPEIPFMYGDYWAICNDRVLRASRKDVEKLNNAFACEELGYIDYEAKKVKARNTMAFWHEMNHYINNDSKKRSVYAVAGMPIVVQAACSSASCIVNKARNVQAPKTLLKTLWRLSLAIGSMWPKMGLGALGTAVYMKHQEKNADLFALSKAKERLELEERRDFFLEYANSLENELLLELEKRIDMAKLNKEQALRVLIFLADPEHPNARSRAARAQKHIDQWDVEHKEE